ncbi:MAG: GNAT family protein [Pseudomonadota bacterium]
MRTGVNTEAKTLLLTFAFEHWDVLRVCLHTDARNERSRAAIARLGATFEGVLRAHRMAPDLTARDSARFSVVAAEWPATRQRLAGLARLT